MKFFTFLNENSRGFTFIREKGKGDETWIWNKVRK